MATVATGEKHQGLLDELLAEIAEYGGTVDTELVTRAFRFAAAAHEGQQRHSGSDFIEHPVGAARICAQLRLDEQTLAAALLHDVVEDTETTIEDVRAEFGDEVARLVEGVTKLTRIQFQSREQAEAENYRKMVVAMSEDVRVILIKLADRLHNMRTIEYLGKQKQIQKAKETLEVYAPLAHRLGIHALKWELEDLAFQTLHPRKYEEITTMVAERRADREGHVAEAADVLARELEKVDIPAEISGPREALLLDLRQDGEEGPRVQRDLRPHRDARHRRAQRRRGHARLLRRARPDPLAVEADAGPVQGLRRDAEVQRLPLAAHDRDRARGPAARDPGAHARDARDGRARCRRALVLVQDPRREAGRGVARLGQAADGRERGGVGRARVRQVVPHRSLRRRGVRVHAEGRGEDAARRRDADRLRVRGAHRRRPPHRRREGERPHRAAALQAEERRPRRGADVEERARPVARLALARRSRRGPATRSGSSSRASRRRTSRRRAAMRSRARSRRRACRTASSPARPCSRA